MTGKPTLSKRAARGSITGPLGKHMLRNLSFIQLTKKFQEKGFVNLLALQDLKTGIEPFGIHFDDQTEILNLVLIEPAEADPGLRPYPGEILAPENKRDTHVSTGGEGAREAERSREYTFSVII